MQNWSGRTLRVVSLAILCVALLAAAAFADREDPRGTPGARAAQHRVEQRGPVGKWHTVHNFTQTVPSPFGKAADSCSGSCNCTFCECTGSESCCDAGCGYCWGYLDGRGSCGTSVQ